MSITQKFKRITKSPDSAATYELDENMKIVITIVIYVQKVTYRHGSYKKAAIFLWYKLQLLREGQLDRVNSRLHIIEEMIGELDIAIRTNQNEMQRDKRQKNYRAHMKIWDNYNRLNVWIIGEIFVEIMPLKLPNLMKTINLHMPEIWWTPEHKKHK